MTYFNDLTPKDRLTKLRKKDVPLMVEVKKFTGHKDTGQNSDKEETNKASSATVLKPLQMGKR